MTPQLIELDIFFEAFERRMAGKLLQPGNMDALGDPTRNRAAPQTVPGKRSTGRDRQARSIS
jgi:hypothetical protein